MNVNSHEPWLVRFVNARWPVLAVAALLLPAWSLRTIASKLDGDRKAQLIQLERLTVTVVAGEPARPVLGVHFMPVYPGDNLRPELAVNARGNGQYELERKRQPLTLFISNDDRTQAAVAEIRSDQATVTVALVPLVTATGRLVRETTGEPLGDVEIEWELSAHHWQSWVRGPHPPGVGGKSRTGADGSFQLPGLYSGADYRLQAIVNVPHYGREALWHLRPAPIRIDAGGSTELGDVIAPDQRSSYEDEFAAEFEPGVPLDDRLSRAQRAARQRKHRVLAVLADPHDEAAFNLRGSLSVYAEMSHHFLLWIGKAEPIAAETRRWAEERSLPIENLQGSLIVALDEQGQCLGHLEVESLASGSESGRRLLAFLEQHAPPQNEGPTVP